VTRIDYGPEVRVHTAQGTVRAKTLVLGCNAYLKDLNPHLSGKVLPAGSYIIATEPLSRTQAARFAAAKHGGVRSASGAGLLPAFGGSTLAVRRCLPLFGPRSAGHWAYMRPKMLEVFPHLKDVKIDYQWGGMIGIGANRLPQIGRLPTSPMCITPRLTPATG
jgi:gamma-glutamylputrescine oxidase